MAVQQLQSLEQSERTCRNQKSFRCRLDKQNSSSFRDSPSVPGSFLCLPRVSFGPLQVDSALEALSLRVALNLRQDSLESQQPTCEWQFDTHKYTALNNSLTAAKAQQFGTIGIIWTKWTYQKRGRRVAKRRNSYHLTSSDTHGPPPPRSKIATPRRTKSVPARTSYRVNKIPLHWPFLKKEGTNQGGILEHVKPETLVLPSAYSHPKSPWRARGELLYSASRQSA